MIKLAFQTPSYNFLALGFFTCGFHVAFISTHMPGVIAYCGLPTSLTGWSLAFIGLFNILGSLFAGWYISSRSKKLFLSSIYFSRALIIILFFILYRLYQSQNVRDRQGILSGYFLIGLCFIRFMVEFVKESQGGIESFLPGLSTGQWLSIPFIILGLILLLKKKGDIRSVN